MGEPEGHEPTTNVAFLWRLCPGCGRVSVRMEAHGGRLDGVELEEELETDVLVQLTAFLTMRVAQDPALHARMMGEMKKLRDELKGDGRG